MQNSFAKREKCVAEAEDLVLASERKQEQFKGTTGRRCIGKILIALESAEISRRGNRKNSEAKDTHRTHGTHERVGKRRIAYID